MQIFQTTSSIRWHRFKWLARAFGFIFLLALAVLIITLWHGYTPAMPRLISAREKQALLSTDDSWLFNNSRIARQYGGFRKYITTKEVYAPGKWPFGKKRQHHSGNDLKHCYKDTATRSTFNSFPAPIRSAFYVDWDAQSLTSLEKNINHLNMVVPEWLFINPNSDTLYANIDEKALAIMRKAGVKIVPILTNNYQEVFRGDAVHRILNQPAKRERLINDLLRIAEQYHFAGVNIDFEELREKKNETLVNFQKELYERLHARGLLVTQDIAPFNDDYNFTGLAQYNDYLFLMAYDQYSENSPPGPISHQKWIEAAVDEAARKVPVNKLILAVAAYGYNWTTGKKTPATTVTYQQAISLAREYESTIDFDNESYNCKFSYTDDDHIAHQVHFTDAASTFNSLRFATEYGLSGVALWRLGSEDDRTWDFYDRDMTKKSLATFNFTDFSSVTSGGTEDNVDYEGEGEILDITGMPRSGHITPEVDTTDMLISEESYDTLPSKWVGRKYGTTDKKKLVLTFDDGPDPVYTPQILDILSKEHTPAAFFIVGMNAENNIPLVKRIYREGHEIGNHTFTHPNIAQVSRQRAVLEMETTRLLIQCITGHSTIMFRAPYNADFEPQKAEELIPVAIAHSKNYLDIGESLDPLDWEPGITADSIVARVIRAKEAMNNEDLSGNIILLHDAGGDSRAATVAALPRIIHYFKARGYTFTTIADLLGKTKNDLMPPVPPGSGYYLVQLNSLLAEAGYWGSHGLFALFVVFIILSMGRLLLMAILAVKQQRKEKKIAWLPVQQYPLVSLIVPAYNEAVNIVNSISNLLKTTYPNIELIVVDDGSKDDTYEKVYAAFHSHPQVKIYTKPNGGKASALNYGINQSAAAFVVCIDADTRLLPDAVTQLMRHFLAPDAGTTAAVAGNVKVGNKVNLLTRWQSIEYITSQNFDRKAFAYLNAITVVPGAIGAFRRSALDEAGGFTSDTLAEDCDLTIRLLRLGYVIKNENNAIALTEAPESVTMFIKQRFRWSFGVMQTFWKHRDVLFNKQYKALGMVAIPNILLFQFIIPVFAPLADFFMIIGLLTGNAYHILSYYIAFMSIDAAIALLAFSFEKENMIRLVWLLPQRLIYRWLMLWVLFKSFLKAIKGELQGWGVLKRTGNVQEIAPVV